MADFFQSFPVAGQDLTTPKGRQVVQDAFDALYDLIQRVQGDASNLDLRGKLSVRSGRGDAPLDGDAGAGLVVSPIDDGLAQRRGFDLSVLGGQRLLEERVEEDRVTTITWRVIEEEDCVAKAQLLDCDKVAQIELGSDGIVRVKDMAGGPATPGLPGFAVDGDSFYGIQADGTKVSLDGGGGGTLETVTAFPWLGSEAYGIGPYDVLTSQQDFLTTAPATASDSRGPVVTASLDATHTDAIYQRTTQPVTVPDGFTGWDTVAISLAGLVNWTGVATGAKARILVNVQKLNGGGGSVSGQRDVSYPTSDGSTYALSTIADTDLTGMAVAPGDVIQFILRAQMIDAGPAATKADFTLGELAINWLGTGGGGGGGGGGTVLSVTAEDATIDVGGTATDPTVAVSAATVATITAAQDAADAAQADATAALSDASDAQADATDGLALAASGLVIDEPAVGINAVWGRFGVLTVTFASPNMATEAAVSRSGNYGIRARGQWVNTQTLRWDWSNGIVLPPGRAIGPLGLSIWHKLIHTAGSNPNDVKLGVITPSANTDDATCQASRTGLTGSDAGYSELKISAALMNALFVPGDTIRPWVSAGGTSGTGTIQLFVHSMRLDLSG